MEVLLGFVVLGALLWFARRHDADHERRHGPARLPHRFKSFGVALIGCPLLILLASWHLVTYAALSVVFFVGAVPLGTGRWTNFRALRDGLFVAWLLSLPVVFVLYATGELVW